MFEATNSVLQVQSGIAPQLPKGLEKNQCVFRQSSQVIKGAKDEYKNWNQWIRQNRPSLFQGIVEQR
jgi:hypothetical protein